MRSILFLLFVLTLHSIAHGQNSVRLFNPKGELFKVWAGGHYVNQNPQAEVLIGNITGDTLKLKLETDKQKSSDITLYLSEKGKRTGNMEFDYIVDFSHFPPKLLFTGMYAALRLPDPLVPLKPVEDTSYKMNNNMLGHFCELKDGRPIYFNNLPRNAVCTEPMPAGYMSYIQFLMSRAQTEDYKYEIAENVCRNNCLSVAQLNSLLQYSGYEIDRLKLVRLAYTHLSDTLNRHQLESSFRFKSSVSELNSFFENAGDYRLKQGGHCHQATDSLSISAFYAKLAVFENDAQRYEVLKKSYDAHCYSLTQVEKLLGYFVHDREKLDAAKLLYFYCTDIENYLRLSTVFSYKETASELGNFVSKQSGK